MELQHCSSIGLNRRLRPIGFCPKCAECRTPQRRRKLSRNDLPSNLILEATRNRICLAYTPRWPADANCCERMKLRKGIMMIRYWNLARILLFLSALTAFCGSASAQQLEPTALEGLGYVGAVSGGGGLTFGAGLAKAIRPRLLVLGEAGYMTLGGYGDDSFDFNFGDISVSSDSSASALEF